MGVDFDRNSFNGEYIYKERGREREKVVSSRLGEIDFEESVMGGRLKFDSRDYIHYFLMRMITC